MVAGSFSDTLDRYAVRLLVAGRRVQRYDNAGNADRQTLRKRWVGRRARTTSESGGQKDKGR